MDEPLRLILLLDYHKLIITTTQLSACSKVYKLAAETSKFADGGQCIRKVYKLAAETCSL